MASAITKLPRKRKMIGSPNGANISAAPPTPHATLSPGPSRAVIGIGTASVIHQMSTHARTAVRRAAPGPRPRGREGS